jgi:hypothetical protein
MWFTTDFVSAISLECNGRWWRLASVGLGLLLAVDWGVDAHAQGSGSNYPDLFDNFSSETANSKLDDAPVWVATTGTGVYSNYPYVDNSQQVQIPISSGLMSAFIQPWDVNLPTPDVMRWPYERTCRRPLRVEFDLLPNLVTANSTTPDGRFSVYFNASNLAQAGGNDAAPLAAVEFAWTHGATGGGTATVQMYAKGSGIGGGFTAVGPQIDVGSFTSGVSRRFRVEFAWDYFITPRNYAAGAWPPSAAKPWAYARVQYFDVASSQWVMPYAPLGSNGWVEFGTVTLSGYGLGSALKTQFDHYDWTDANHAYLPAFTHFYAAREGTGDVTWTLDNVHLYAPPQPPFSIMVNTIGYDVAGPQWVAIRPSDPQLRADPSATEIQSIAWNLYDSTGHSLRSATTSTNGDPCFKEVVDLEAWNASGIGSEGNGYTVKPLYWWRWEWSPPVTDPQVGCYVTAAINYVISGSNASYTATSDRFDLQPELHHRYLVRGQTTLGGIGADNAEQRELTTTTTFSGLAAGFADAGNENGEHRSHGLFTSGLSHVLRQRRPEMTTADVQRYIHGIEVGANFLLLEGKAENAYAASGLRLHTTDRSTDALKGHAIDPVGGSSPPNADNGHIWHEHHSRFNGGYGPTSNDTIDNKTVGNSASLEYIAALGLIDAARTLKAYDPTTAATYFTQASDTRTYLYDLSGYFGTSAY